MYYNIPYIMENKFKDIEYNLDGADYKNMKPLNGSVLPSLQDLENADNDLLSVKYKIDRFNLYNERGATIQDISVALWKKIMENDSQSADDLQVIRLQVQRDIPKPPGT